MFVVDSNIWIYYLDRTLFEHTKVADFMNELIRNHTISITNFIAVEVIHFLFKRLSKDEAQKKALIFQQGGLQYIDFQFEDLDDHIEMMKKTSGSGLGGRDISILVCMKKHNISKLVTHDQSFCNLEDIEIIDPINHQQ